MKESYDTFKDELLSLLESKLDPGYVLRTDTVTKNNGITKTGLAIRKGIEGVEISPTIYVEDLYESYNGYNMNAIADETYYNLTSTSDVSFDTSKVMTLDYVKENAYLKVINTKANYEYLMDKPYYPVGGFEDLSAIIILRVEVNGEISGNTVVTDEMLEILDLSKNELFEYAKTNSMSKEPASFKSMRDVLIETMGISEDDPMADMMLPPDDGMMNVLMNKSSYLGASTIMYDGVLNDIHSKLGEDFVIIPSSIHEVIILPKSKAPEKEELLGMIRSINDGVVDPSDKLSDNAYMYSGASATVSMITDAGSGAGATAE